MRRGAPMFAAVLMAAASMAAAQGPDVTVTLTGRVQVQYNTTSVGDEDLGPGPGPRVASSTFETRRVRLGTRVRVQEWITGVLDVELALGDLAMRNVFMNLGFSDAFQLRMGQFKKPFSLVNLTSSSQIPAIERGVRIRGLKEALRLSDVATDDPVLGDLEGALLIGEEHDLLAVLGYLGFEIGAALHGEAGAFGWELGVFNGSGEDRRDTNDGKSFAARATLAVADLPLVLGVAGSRRELAVGTTSLSGTAFEADAEWGGFRSPLHVQLEVTTGENFAAADASFLAAQLAATVFRPTGGERVEGWEVLGRASWGDPNRDRDGDDGLLLTPGVALYFFGRNRLQLNWDVFLPGGDRFETMHALRAQAQLYF